MPVVFDANILIDYFNPNLQGDRRAKVDHLAQTLEKKGDKIIIPTPALTELLVGAGKARDEYYKKLSSSRAFKIEPFNSRAAIECALLLAEAWSPKEQRKVAKVKFKFDWQIVAIAASCNVSAIYSDDPDIERYAKRVNIQVTKTDDLPLPDSARQYDLPLDHPSR
jgi:predicted nucleic acid-binding protein